MAHEACGWAVVTALAPRIERSFRSRLVRCDVIPVGEDDRTFRVVLPHEGPSPGPIARQWLERAVHAFELDDNTLVPVTASVVDAQPFRHELHATVADLGVRSRLRVHPKTGLSNVLALVITTGIGAPHRVRNRLALTRSDAAS